MQGLCVRSLRPEGPKIEHKGREGWVLGRVSELWEVYGKRCKLRCAVRTEPRKTNLVHFKHHSTLLMVEG